MVRSFLKQYTHPPTPKKNLRERFDQLNDSLDNIKIQKTEYVDKMDIKSENTKGYFNSRRITQSKIP